MLLERTVNQDQIYLQLPKIFFTVVYRRWGPQKRVLGFWFLSTEKRQEFPSLFHLSHTHTYMEHTEVIGGKGRKNQVVSSYQSAKSSFPPGNNGWVGQVGWLRAGLQSATSLHDKRANEMFALLTWLNLYFHVAYLSYHTYRHWKEPAFQELLNFCSFVSKRIQIV